MKLIIKVCITLSIASCMSLWCMIPPSIEEVEVPSALHIAAARGNKNEVQRLLASGINVNTQDSNHYTPLHVAAWAGHIKIVKILLAAGANPNIQHTERSLPGMRKRTTPLDYAVDGKHAKVVKILLAAGANYGPQKEQQNLLHGSACLHTPSLHAAVASGNKNEVQRHLESGANVNEQGQFSTPLHDAAHFEYIEIVKILLTAGANHSIQDSRGYTPLHTAACAGHEKVVKILLDAGANHGARNNKQWTPLHHAAVEGHEKVVEVLLAAGARHDVQNEEQDTPLHCAAAGGHEEVVTILLAAGANHQAQNKTQWTPLHCAAGWGREEVVEVLLAAGANHQAQDNVYRTPLQCAAACGHANVIKILSAAGGNHRMHGGAQLTLLQHTAPVDPFGPNIPPLQVIQSQTSIFHSGGSPNPPANSEITPKNAQPLQSIASQETPPALKELPVQPRAASNSIRLIEAVETNNDDAKWQSLLKTVLDASPVQVFSLHEAAARGDKNNIQKLLEACSALNGQDKHKKTALHYAVEHKFKEIVELLIDKNANPNVCDIFGYTPLHWAAKNGDPAIVAILLKARDININIPDKMSQLTPLCLAIQEGHRKIVEILLKRPEIDVNRPSAFQLQAAYSPSPLTYSPLHSAVIAALKASLEENQKKRKRSCNNKTVT